jgi:hypothetical protein
VGANNAGKSTAIEALRLVSLVTNRLRGLNFRPPPKWLEETGRGTWGVSPSLRGFEFRLARHIFHRYADPPATIDAVFDAGTCVSVYIGPEEDVFAVVRGPEKQPAFSRQDLRDWDLPRLGVQPQVGPLDDQELLLKERTVRQGLDSSLSPRHFRNQLVLMPDLIDEFRDLAQETWPGLQIREFNWKQAGEGQPLELMIRVDDFVGEVSLMGHGLQMWLQLMWFLVRARSDHVVVLDEPDVFMHPDLQRRLIRYLRRRQQQVVIATHSVEMLADVEPHEVVGLVHGGRAGRRSRSLRDLQTIVEEIGGVQNLQLARLERGQRFLFVEGKDLDLLDKIHAAEEPGSLESLAQVPHASTDGWDDWATVVGAARLLRTQFGSDFRIYCIYDSDYRWPKQLAERRRAARREGIDLHIWSWKELENYLLIPDVIARVLMSRSPRPPDAEAVAHKIEAIAGSMRADIVGGFQDELEKLEPRLQPSTLAKRAAVHLDKHWAKRSGMIARVPGKGMRSALSAWSSKRSSGSFGTAALAANLRQGEVDGELRAVIRAIAAGEPFT